MNKVEEIINALKIIKNTCNSTMRCNDCPFYCDSNGMCIIQSILPAHWDISEENPIWRAFK